MTPKYRIIPIGSGVPSGGYATSISVTMDENYVLSVQLLNQNGDPIGDEQTVDLPLESVVVGGSYDSEHQQLILTLDNGNTIAIPISDLISGLQAEITPQNPLSADLVADGTTNKVFTATEQSKLAGIEAGAQVNPANVSAFNNDAGYLTQNTVIINQAFPSGWHTTGTLSQLITDINSDSTAVKGKSYLSTVSFSDLPSSLVQGEMTVQIMDEQAGIGKVILFTLTSSSESPYHWEYTSAWGGTSQWRAWALDSQIPTVNNATITVKQNGQADQTFTLNQSSNQDVTIAAGGGNAWYGTQWEFDHLQNKDADTDYFISDKLDYNTDLKNTPNLGAYATKSEVNTKNTEQDTAIAGKMSGHFMTQQEFEQISPKEGDNYFIQGDTIELVVTFTDQTTATYNVVVD